MKPVSSNAHDIYSIILHQNLTIFWHWTEHFLTATRSSGTRKKMMPDCTICPRNQHQFSGSRFCSMRCELIVRCWPVSENRLLAVVITSMCWTTFHQLIWHALWIRIHLRWTPQWTVFKHTEFLRSPLERRVTLHHIHCNWSCTAT